MTRPGFEPEPSATNRLSYGTAMLVSCLACSSTLKMVAICSSKTLVNFQQTLRHYIPEVRVLQNVFVVIVSDVCHLDLKNDDKAYWPNKQFTCHPKIPEKENTLFVTVTNKFQFWKWKGLQNILDL
jgi:hypothetical protein